MGRASTIEFQRMTRFARGYGRRVHVLAAETENNPARYRTLCLCGNFADKVVPPPPLSAICKSCLKAAKAKGIIEVGEPCPHCNGTGRLSVARPEEVMG